jgi:chemotaxis regulatin CheY-phosphate phosphatase CheZ
MKANTNMDDLLTKLDDLKNVFEYGKKIIPVVQQLIDFMHDIVPLLENINNSITESSHKIPRVKDHICDVTNATELATTEILDVVDLISNRIEDIEKSFKIADENEKKRYELYKELRVCVKDNDKAVEILDKIDILEAKELSFGGLLNSIIQIKEDVQRITISLQVQDITSQQLASVNHLIDSVKKKLDSLVMVLEKNEIDDFEKVTTVQNSKYSAFNPDARYGNSKENQDLADSLVNEVSKKASQEEIDKLFS